MIDERGEVTMWDERGGPKVEDMVDEALREVGFEVQNFSELESSPRFERGPVVVGLLGWWCWW